MITRYGVEKRYSDIAIHNKVIYLAGQVTSDETLCIKEQTKDVLNQIDKLLSQAGSDKSLILRAEIYLKNIADYDSMNEVWDSWVQDGSAPPRATIEAALAKSQYKVEIVITAAQKD